MPRFVVSLMVSYPVVSYQFWYAPLSLQNGGSMSFNLALHGKSRHLEITDELVVRRPLKQGGYSSNEQRPSEAARKGDLVAGTYPGGEAMGAPPPRPESKSWLRACLGVEVLPHSTVSRKV